MIVMMMLRSLMYGGLTGFRFAAVADLWEAGLSVRPYAGRFGKGKQWAAGKYSMIVEDPFIYNENCAR